MTILTILLWVFGIFGSIILMCWIAIKADEHAYTTSPHINKNATGPYTANNSTNTTTKTKRTPVGVSKVVEPPRPCFFGRLDGQTIDSEGDFEIYYLSKWQIQDYCIKNLIPYAKETEYQAKRVEIADMVPKE